MHAFPSNNCFSTEGKDAFIGRDARFSVAKMVAMVASATERLFSKMPLDSQKHYMAVRATMSRKENHQVW